MHEHHEWLLEVYNLSTGKAVSKEPLQLENFYGSEIGSTACFTIFEGHFYAVTNQTSLESEEVDWTSYYHFISFPLDDPCPDLRIRVIWRRQHVEGPINDAWTLLEFQHDHRTGESLIIECRKEWKNGGSRSFRTFYTQPFHRAQHQELTDGLRHPPDDPLSKTLDKENNSRYEAARPRVEKYVHSEEGATGCIKEYIRAKTKWNGYCFNSQSFVDIVTEEYRADGEWRPRERVKLRVVSREDISPLVVDTINPMRAGGLIVRPRKRDREGEEMLDGEDEFSTSHISLWPEDDAPQSLQEILCPGGRVSEVQAVLGDEGLIYMAGPPGGYGERALVFVSFDPTFGFEGMTRLDGTLVREKERGREPSSMSSLARKRKSHSDNHVEERTRDLEPSHDQLQTENKDRASSNLPDRTKRVKTDDQAINESISCPADIYPNVSSTSMATLTPTPSGWPPSLPFPQTVESPSSPSGQDESSTMPSSFSSSSSASSVAPARQTCASSSSKISSATPATNPTSTSGLLTWRERARYLSIANGIWTR
ncbi:hypothetical protein LTR84_005111 [Exophiala bonariae]|uniref:Uncharacterized protein n=1 Tax=Exophiala bonariae TaxID=1690606 RepID=A0AAV9NSJ1_9EURO|nr:hypothetical protein LTR84_005111 [Exophiala bonariae]